MRIVLIVAFITAVCGFRIELSTEYIKDTISREKEALQSIIDHECAV